MSFARLFTILYLDSSGSVQSGKAQMFSRIGAREFVPFAGEDITLSNIKLPCEKHFLPTVDKSVTCDVLAGKQGTSCSTLEQIPDLELIHIRFIERKKQDHESNIFPSPDEPSKRVFPLLNMLDMATPVTFTLFFIDT